MQLKPKISFILLASFLLLLSFPSFAQRKKKDKKQEEQKEVTKYERANAEYLLIEAQKYFLLEDYQKSQAFLEQSLEVDNKNHAAYFKLAEIHFMLSKSDEGLAAITNAISITPDNKYYYLLSAQLFKQKQDLASAALAYEQMIENTTDYYDYLLDLVDIYVALNRFDKAIETIVVLEGKYGETTRFAIQKSTLLLASGDSGDAIKLIKDLIDTGNNDKELLMEYANLISNFRSVQDAIDFLVSIDPFIESDLFLMQLYSEINQPDKANELILKSFDNPNIGLQDKVKMVNDLLRQAGLLQNEALLISLQTKLNKEYPMEAQVIELSGEIYWELSKVNDASSNQYREKAIGSFIELKDVDPSSIELWNRILEAEYNSKKWTDLLDHSNEALDLFPNQGLFYFYNGASAMENNETNTALTAFKQGLRLSSKNIELTSRILGKEAQISFKEGEIEIGLEQYEKAINLENSHPEVLNNYSLELALRKLHLEKAIELSKHLVSLDRSSTEYIYTRGFVLFQANQFAEGENLLGGSIANADFLPNGKILELYGDLLFKMNKPEEGLIQWQKAQSLGGGSNKLEQKIATKTYYE
jgi:predicted Zn-dependent protease